MKLLALIVFLCIPGFLPDGGATFTKDEFISMKDDPSIFPSTVHIYYYDTLRTDLSFDTRSLVIYGDGTVLITNGIIEDDLDNIEYYVCYDCDIVEAISINMIELAMFDSKSEVKYNLDALGIEVRSYYLSIRIGEDYYTINFADYKGEEPSWYPLIEYIQNIINEYIVEEYSIEATEYLEILDINIDIYGKHPLFTGDFVRRHLEENEDDE